MRDDSFWAGIIGIAIFMAFFAGVIATVFVMTVIEQPATTDLGNAICSANHKGEFYSYSDGVVKCKPVDNPVKYDGIIIKDAIGIN